MTYRCEACGCVPEKGHKRQTHQLYKVVNGLRQIERELAVCVPCKSELELGVSLSEVMSRKAATAKAVAPRTSAVRSAEEAPTGEVGRPKKAGKALESGDADRCDLCGGHVGEGQRTDQGVICDKHLPKRGG